MDNVWAVDSGKTKGLDGARWRKAQIQMTMVQDDVVIETMIPTNPLTATASITCACTKITPKVH